MKQRAFRQIRTEIYLSKKARPSPGPVAYYYELYNHVNSLNNSFAPFCILQTGAFFCLCEPPSYSGAFHKNFLPFAVAKIAIPGLLRRKGGNHHPRACGLRREVRK